MWLRGGGGGSWFVFNGNPIVDAGIFNLVDAPETIMHGAIFYNWGNGMVQGLRCKQNHQNHLFFL